MTNFFDQHHHLHTDTVNLTRVMFPGVLVKYFPELYTQLDYSQYQKAFSVKDISQRIVSIFLQVCDHHGTFDQLISRAYIIFNGTTYKDGTPLLSFKTFYDIVNLLSITYYASQTMLQIRYTSEEQTTTFWKTFNTITHTDQQMENSNDTLL